MTTAFRLLRRARRQRRSRKNRFPLDIGTLTEFVPLEVITGSGTEDHVVDGLSEGFASNAKFVAAAGHRI